MNSKIFLTLINIVVLVFVAFILYRLCMVDYGTVISGDLWTAKRYGSKYIVSIKNHADFNDAVTDFVKKENIKVGYISGVGSAGSVTLRFYDASGKKHIDKTFNEQVEISNLVGNISTDDASPYFHLHIVCGRKDYSTISGHFVNAKVNGSTELWVEDIPTARTPRKYDQETGLRIFDF